MIDFNEIQYRKILQSDFPLYNDSDCVNIINRRYLTVDYSTYGRPSRISDSCILSLNFDIHENIAYLLSIHIPKPLRGQGYGQALYNIAEKVASILGSKYIEQTPSGMTGTGEPRMSYLLRRGYRQFGDVVRKML